MDCGLLQRSDARARRVGEHARWLDNVSHYRGSRVPGGMDRLRNAAHRGTAMKRSSVIAAVMIAALLGGCGEDPKPSQYSPNPQLPQPHRGLLPNMTIAEPANWGDQRPTVPKGYAISAIATDLQIPRQTLLLP